MSFLAKILGGKSAATMVRDREGTHGNYEHRAQIVDGLIGEMERSPWWETLRPTSRQSLRMMADKMSRIIEGDEAEKDHWIDIGGYALLGLKATEGFRNSNQTFEAQHVPSTDNTSDEEHAREWSGKEDTASG